MSIYLNKIKGFINDCKRYYTNIIKFYIQGIIALVAGCGFILFIVSNIFNIHFVEEHIDFLLTLILILYYIFNIFIHDSPGILLSEPDMIYLIKNKSCFTFFLATRILLFNIIQIYIILYLNNYLNTFFVKGVSFSCLLMFVIINNLKFITFNIDIKIIFKIVILILLSIQVYYNSFFIIIIQYIIVIFCSLLTITKIEYQNNYRISKYMYRVNRNILCGNWAYASSAVMEKRVNIVKERDTSYISYNINFFAKDFIIFFRERVITNSIFVVFIIITNMFYIFGGLNYLNYILIIFTYTLALIRVHKILKKNYILLFKGFKFNNSKNKFFIRSNLFSFILFYIISILITVYYYGIVGLLIQLIYVLGLIYTINYNIIKNRIISLEIILSLIYYLVMLIDVNVIIKILYTIILILLILFIHKQIDNILVQGKTSAKT